MNSLFKKAALSSALTLAMSGSAMAEIIITEYIEGSSNNKAIELTNVGSEAIDMGAAKYKLAMYSNGSATEHDERKVELTGTLAPGASYVFYNDGAEDVFKVANGEASSVTWFNGDDALVLTKDGVVVDAFGRVGEDPGSAWESGDFSTANKTLRRKNGITSGDTVMDDEFPGTSLDQWVVFDINTADGLGCGGEAACSGGGDTGGGDTGGGDSGSAADPIMITEYVEGSSNNKAVEITNTGSVDVDLGAGKYKLAMYSNGSETEHDERKIEFTGTLAAGASYVLYNDGAEDAFKVANGEASSVTWFNGDDALVLTKDGVVIDSFGKVGERPDGGWTDPNDANFHTQNKTLRRKNSVTEGDKVINDDFPGSPNQWAVFDIDTADGLGCGGEAACGSGGDTGGGDTGGGDTGGNNADPIRITEYVEGSSNNKAVEISNMGTAAVDLAAGNYRLSMYSNGSETPHDERYLDLSVTLEPGKSFVIFNDGAWDEFKIEGGVASSVTWFNGDDALVLTKNGVVVDSFGRVGERPDGGWTDANDPNFNTLNKTLRRKDSVSAGDIIINDAFPGDNNEWAVFGENTSNGLGCPGEGPCVDLGGGEAIENFLIITEYIEGSGSNKAIELTNIGQTALDLLTEGYRLAAYNNGRITESNALNLFGKLPPNASVVIYNRDADDEFKPAAPAGIGSNVTFFNGDDAIVLTKGGIVVDSLGRVGEDPGSSWTDANNADFSTANKTIRRKASVTVGDHIVTDEFPGADNQWVTFDINTADGLGCGGESACTGTEPQAEVGVGGGVTFGDCVNCAEISKVTWSGSYAKQSYYASVFAVRDAERMDKINAVISAGHVPMTYSQVWSVLTFSDEDPANSDNIIELYTGNSVPKNMNGSGDNANNPDSWNREHVWSKSHGFPNEAQEAYTDAHHLRPADWSMNTERSELDFDWGGDPIEESPLNLKDSDSFEPRDEVKGDVARMLFYMAARYNGADTDKTPDLVLVDAMTDFGTPQFGKLCSLYQWHLDDAVSQAEMTRNEVVYEYQGNRNPFIDHPDWVDDIWADQCRPATVPEVSISGPFVVKEGETVTLSATAVDADGDEVTYHWRQTSDAFIHFEPYGSSVSFTTPNISEDTVIEFELTVTDDNLNEVTATYKMVVEADTDSGGVAGGAVSYLALLLLPLAGLRRRFIKA